LNQAEDQNLENVGNHEKEWSDGVVKCWSDGAMDLSLSPFSAMDATRFHEINRENATTLEMNDAVPSG
jgi:hypothetical protein